jgi:hypothetical protein
LATHNLIQKQTVMKDQDKIMRGLKSWLDTVQDQLWATPLGVGPLGRIRSTYLERPLGSSCWMHFLS